MLSSSNCPESPRSSLSSNNDNSNTSKPENKGLFHLIHGEADRTYKVSEKVKENRASDTEYENPPYSEDVENPFIRTKASSSSEKNGKLTPNVFAFLIITTKNNISKN